jgi:hypothetical protein
MIEQTYQNQAEIERTAPCCINEKRIEEFGVKVFLKRKFQN